MANFGKKTSNLTFDWDWLEPADDTSHVLANPSYTACTRTGTFWLDSPVFSETGCYTTLNFQHGFRNRMGDYDLVGFRKSKTAFCLKNTEKKYCSIAQC